MMTAGTGSHVTEGGDPSIGYRIGEVAERAGIAVPTLRSWERRYGLLDPDRTAGGHRVYRPADVARVLTVRDLVSRGFPVREAARMVVEGDVPPAPTPEPAPDPAQLADALWSAIDRFDSAQATRIIEEGLRRVGLATVLDGVAVPVLRRLGETWRESDRAIGREHLGSQLLRARLMDRLREPELRTREIVVACSPRGEHHDLGTLMASVALASAGWRVRFLGAHTPASVVGAVVRDLRPRVLLIGAQLTRPAHAFLDGLRLDPSVTVVLGGTGFRQVPSSVAARVTIYDGTYAALPATLDGLTAPGD